MKIALCQINTIIGDIEFNKSKILDGYNKAVKDGADLAIFPELSLIGYPALDLVEKKEFRLASTKALFEIASQTGDTGLLFGTITEDDDNIGTDIHNSAILCYNGKLQFIQHKSLIPNYDVFDEMRYFDSAKNVYVHKFKGEQLGISICEDIWNDADYWYKQRYINDPVKELIQKGASVIINISASPYSFSKRENRKRMLSVLSKTEKVPLAYVCTVGAQAELIFDGASMCFDTEGNLVRLGKSFEEDYFIFDTKEEYKSIEKTEGSFEKETLNALIYGLKEYCIKENFKKVLLGLSGGMDSALVTYIAVEAIGAENVRVMLMPSKYSSDGSITDSEKLIQNLGISSSNISIQPVVNEALNILSSIVTEAPRKIVEENIQARIRGVYLMAVSNQFDYLVLSTSNKSEMAVGYSTLYGDMCGGLGVIADVYKTDVYRIANYINRDRKIIPQTIFDKAPSAELSPGQKDQDILPPYELLDKILQMYLEENKEIDEITSVIGERETVKKVLRMVDKSEFKRRQAAPALRVSSKAFGYGRRYPIVQGWRR
ncbi:MAG: NAD+ synthase [Ignavibacteriales bacterium]|nr:MAG: NAD+ synthase [Ignavibacteriales bacterium]